MISNIYIFLSFVGLSYLLGSISAGYLIVKFKKGIDIRKVGSGAIGGTNVGRVLGKKWAVFVGLFDMAKSALPVFFANNYLHFLDWQICVVIVAAVLGHIYPIFLKFKGGKGVATTFGGLLPIFGWKIILFVLIIFLPLLYILKISSFASLTFASFLPFFLFSLTFNYSFFILGFLLFFIIWWAHRENIQRIAQGKEKRSGLV